MRQQGARNRYQQSNKKMSWKATDVQKSVILDKYGRTAGCPGCVGNGQHSEECGARIEKEMVDKGDAIKLETSGNCART